jgi:hypothetical protein
MKRLYQNFIGLLSKIEHRLGLLLNKQKGQACGPSPKPRPNRAQTFGLVSKSDLGLAKTMPLDPLPEMLKYDLRENFIR